MTKKRMTAEQFDAILPGNTSRSVLAARMVLVDGVTYRDAANFHGISSGAITQAIHRMEREQKK